MDLKPQVEGYLAVTDPAHYLTYDVYAAKLIEEGRMPIKKSQWDMLASNLGGRKMATTDIVPQYRENMISALADMLPTSGKAGSQPIGCAACDRGDYHIGHHDDCPRFRELSNL